MPHVIRLRGPWEYETLEQGAVRCLRRFHCPTGLTAESRVWLVIEEVDGQANVVLNCRELGEIFSGRAGSGRFDITAHLQPLNLLTITVAGTRKIPVPPGLIGQVRLEIE